MQIEEIVARKTYADGNNCKRTVSQISDVLQEVSFRSPSGSRGCARLKDFALWAVKECR